MVIVTQMTRTAYFALLISAISLCFTGCVVDENRMFQGVWRLSQPSEPGLSDDKFSEVLHGYPSLGIGHYGRTATGLVWFHTTPLDIEPVNMCACQLIEQEATGTSIDLIERTITFTSRCVTSDEDWSSPQEALEPYGLYWDLQLVTLDDPSGRVMEGTVSVLYPGPGQSSEPISVRFESDRFGEMEEQDKQCRP